MEAKKNDKEPRMHHSNYFSHTMCCQQKRLNGKGLINNKALLYQGCGVVHNPANGLALKNASLTSQRFVNFNLFLHNVVLIIISINNGSTFIYSQGSENHEHKN
jgi:hypothetical protein